jgi:hypothetical protein
MKIARSNCDQGYRVTIKRAVTAERRVMHLCANLS